MIPFLLDHSALLALGRGHRQLSGLIVAAAEGKAHGHVSALCLAVAEAVREGIAEHVASLPGLEVEPLDLPAALDTGGLLAAGVDWRIMHAVHLARPSAEWPAGRAVLSFEPKLYEGTGVEPVTPDAM
ncbi:hypothetical protein ACFY0Z_29310 [Streptomyces kronopolitis]|uniref:hypothetical protein n=1 Tax=Streptomyces kronopolitis TaxID=1612435 RepID=UPI0036BA771D